jgi:hypothetical protein
MLCDQLPVFIEDLETLLEGTAVLLMIPHAHAVPHALP